MKYILDRSGVWHVELELGPRRGPPVYGCRAATTNAVFTTNDLEYVTRSKRPFCVGCDGYLSRMA